MNLAEIKLDLFRKIDSLKEDRLKEAYGVFLNYLNGTGDHWAELSEGEKSSIEEGLAQIKAGKVTPHNEVMTGFRQRYGQ